MHAMESAHQRNETVLKYFPLVKATAVKIHRRLPPQVELDDLISVGIMGLIEAVDRFDPGRNVSLATYARQRVHGSIVDALRAQDWVPRTVRERVAKLNNTKQELRDRLGRSPPGRKWRKHLEYRWTNMPHCFLLLKSSPWFLQMRLFPTKEDFG